jgi:Ku70/Ku80 beta-barrel domain
MSVSTNHRLRPTPASDNGPGASAPAPAPRGRPSWSGLLRISLVSVPVKAYPAVRSAVAAPFHFLHAECGQRLRYAKHCPQHGAVPADAIARGYEYAPHHHVIMEAEELEQFRPARDKALVLEQFVPVGDIDPTFYAGRSLYLLPDGVAAQHPVWRTGRSHAAGRPRGLGPGGAVQPAAVGRGATLWPLAGPGCPALSRPGTFPRRLRGRAGAPGNHRGRVDTRAPVNRPGQRAVGVGSLPRSPCRGVGRFDPGQDRAATAGRSGPRAGGLEPARRAQAKRRRQPSGEGGAVFGSGPIPQTPRPQEVGMLALLPCRRPGCGVLVAGLAEPAGKPRIRFGIALNWCPGRGNCADPDGQRGRRTARFRVLSKGEASW